MSLFTCAATGAALGWPVTLASPWPARGGGGSENGGHGFGRPQGALKGFAGVPPRALLQDLDDSILLQDLGMKGFQPGEQERQKLEEELDGERRIHARPNQTPEKV